MSLAGILLYSCLYHWFLQILNCDLHADYIPQGVRSFYRPKMSASPTQLVSIPAAEDWFQTVLKKLAEV